MGFSFGVEGGGRLRLLLHGPSEAIEKHSE